MDYYGTSYGKSLLNGGSYLAPLVYKSNRIPSPVKPIVGQLVREAGNRLPGMVFDRIRSRVITSLEISASDPAFEWVNDWAADQPFMRKSSKLRINSRPAGYSMFDEDDSRGLSTKNVRYHAASGTYRFRYNNHVMWFTLRQNNWGAGIDLVSRRSSFSSDYIELKVLGTSAEPIHSLINEACAAAQRRTQRTINLFYGGDGWWNRSGTQRTRPLESVILPEGRREKIEADVKRFIDQSSWYFDKAIPYRRGYLLYGLPGSGKSSVVLALASQFSLPIYVLNLATNRISDDGLAQMMSSMSSPSILLLEDVDALFGEQVVDPLTTTSRELDSSVSFSGLLNALDGVSASQGRLLFMTTNHIERLDPALIRPGRIDVRLEFTYADAYQAAQLHQRFFPALGADAASEYGEWVASNQMSMADVQEHLLNKSSEELAIGSS